MMLMSSFYILILNANTKKSDIFPMLVNSKIMCHFSKGNLNNKGMSQSLLAFNNITQIIVVNCNQN